MRIITRNPYTDEIPLLKEMWRIVFGDDGVDAFFEHLFSPEHTIIAETESGEPAAMGYIVPMGELLTGENVLSCVMLYSIATAAEHRGKGLGAAVTNALISSAFEQGFDAAVLCPSSDSLYNYYGKHTSFREYFYAEETGISTASLGVKHSMAESTDKCDVHLPHLIDLTPAKYNQLRETLLAGTVHINYSAACLEYQKLLCSELGGGFYGICDSCAVIEVQSGGAVHVKELLIADSDDKSEIISATNAAFPSQEYVYRTPAKTGEGRRFGMIAARDGVNISFGNGIYAPWYGLAFD